QLLSIGFKSVTPKKSNQQWNVDCRFSKDKFAIEFCKGFHELTDNEFVGYMFDYVELQLIVEENEKRWTELYDVIHNENGVRFLDAIIFVLKDTYNGEKESNFLDKVYDMLGNMPETRPNYTVMQQRRVLLGQLLDISNDSNSDGTVKPN
ncbi:unnamed protein product, partial [Didymodactylos carnosus]